MTDKVVEVVAQAIALKDPRKSLDIDDCVRIQDRHYQMAAAAIDAYLKALEKEGKRVMSEHNIQELTMSRKVYEG